MQIWCFKNPGPTATCSLNIICRYRSRLGYVPQSHHEFEKGKKKKKTCPEGERRRGGPQFPRGSMSTGSWSHPANLNTSQLRSSHFCKHSNAVAFPPESCWLSQTPCRCYSPNAPEHQADLHQRTTACTSRNCDCCIPSVLGNNLIYSADNG